MMGLTLYIIVKLIYFGLYSFYYCFTCTPLFTLSLPSFSFTIVAPNLRRVGTCCERWGVCRGWEREGGTQKREREGEGEREDEGRERGSEQKGGERSGEGAEGSKAGEGTAESRVKQGKAQQRAE
jgi:hypothetical protein